jgi:hypothetical protein
VATASIAVSVKARTRDFNRKLKQSGRNVETFGARVRRLARGIAKFGTAITAVAAGGMAIFIKQSFSTLDALAKTSDRLGITADKLRGFERAAELSGSTIEVFRKGIQNMSKNIAEAASGTGEAKDTLAALRLDAAKLVRLKPDEVFLRISKAIKGMPSQIQKIGAMSDIFGMRGISLLNMIELGDKRLRAMLETSVRLSGSFSRLDLSAIERANDAIADMRRAFRGIIDTLAVQFADPLTAIAEKLTDWLVGVRRALFDSLPGIGNFIKRVIDLFDSGLRAIARVGFKLAADLSEAFAHLPGDAGIAFAKIHRRIVEASGIARPAHLGGRPLAGESIAAAVSEAVEAVQWDLGMSAIKGWVSAMRHEFKFFETLFRNPMEFFAEPLRRFGQALDQGMTKGATTISLAVASPNVARRSGEFMQVSPTRFHIPGVTDARREQTVRDTQTHRRLDELIRLYRVPGVGVAG